MTDQYAKQGGYREAGRGRSAALDQLAEEARAAEGTRAVPAHECVLSRQEITGNLEHAVGVHQDRSGGITIVAGLTSLFAFMAITAALKGNTAPMTGGEKIFFVLLILAALATMTAALVRSDAAKTRRAKAVDEELAWADRQPFPVTGYRDWLVHGEAILVVTLNAEVEKETFVDAVKAIDPRIKTEAVDATSFSLVIPPRSTAGDPPRYYGDVPLLKSVFERLVLPLHDDIGVARVAMSAPLRCR